MTEEKDSLREFSDRISAAVRAFRVRHAGRCPERIFISEDAFYDLADRNPVLRDDPMAFCCANFEGVMASPFPTNRKEPVFYLGEEELR